MTDAAQSRARREAEIVRVLRTAGHPLMPSEIWNALSENEATIKTRLRTMVESGALVVTGTVLTRTGPAKLLDVASCPPPRDWMATWDAAPDHERRLNRRIGWWLGRWSWFSGLSQHTLQRPARRGMAVATVERERLVAISVAVDCLPALEARAVVEVHGPDEASEAGLEAYWEARDSLRDLMMGCLLAPARG